MYYHNSNEKWVLRLKLGLKKGGEEWSEELPATMMWSQEFLMDWNWAKKLAIDQSAATMRKAEIGEFCEFKEQAKWNRTREREGVCVSDVFNCDCSFTVREFPQFFRRCWGDSCLADLVHLILFTLGCLVHRALFMLGIHLELNFWYC